MLNTLRSWPYFKFYANDWLTSNTVQLMTLAQQGAYLGLLCNAWTEESCTVPADPDLLKKLARWTEAEGDFSPILACFPLTRNRKRRYNPRLFNERQEALAYRAKQSEGGKKGMDSRWASKPGGKKKRTTEPRQVDDWLPTLQALPIYAHVNWPQEMGKIHEWHSRPENQHRIINQRFVANWANKIQVPLSNGHSQPLICPHHPNKTFTDAKEKRGHDQIYHPKFEG